MNIRLGEQLLLATFSMNIRLGEQLLLATFSISIVFKNPYFVKMFSIFTSLSLFLFTKYNKTEKAFTHGHMPFVKWSICGLRL